MSIFNMFRLGGQIREVKYENFSMMAKRWQRWMSNGKAKNGRLIIAICLKALTFENHYETSKIRNYGFDHI